MKGKNILKEILKKNTEFHDKKLYICPIFLQSMKVMKSRQNQ